MRVWVARFVIVMLALSVNGCVSLREPDIAGPATDAPDLQEDEHDDVFDQLHLLTKALVHVRRDYFDESRTAYQDLMHGALRGMLQSLDPYSQFLDSEALRGLREDSAGEFGGIGITIGVRDNILTVIAPMEDTPAFRAGILAGDRIVEIDGRKTEGLNIAEAVSYLRGDPETVVDLKIMRENQRELQNFKLVRDVIRVSNVRGERMLPGAIGYVRITQFSETTAENLQQALTGLLDNGMQALVLDLRNNSGGLLGAAIAVSQKFLPDGAPIVTTRGRGDKVVGAPVKASGRYHYPDFPLAILVNGGTASAAEIVAASLQDNLRAIIVGEKTFGKGSVQSVLPLGEDVAVRLTTARYYTPSERVIHEQGIEPDITVPMKPETWRRVQIKRIRQENPDLARELEVDENDGRDVVDTQLERATDILKALLIFHGQSCS